jgi:hypothetical protein
MARRARIAIGVTLVAWLSVGVLAPAAWACHPGQRCGSHSPPMRLDSIGTLPFSRLDAVLLLAGGIAMLSIGVAVCRAFGRIGRASAHFQNGSPGEASKAGRAMQSLPVPVRNRR